MRIYLTGSDTLLGAALRRALGESHELHAPSPEPRDRAAIAEAAAGCDAVVHLVPPAADQDDLDALDRATRGTYDLLTAASPSRFVLVTSLRPFARYPASWLVTEQWMPRPAPTATDLAPYLAELTAREVARVRPVEAIVLRLGEVVDPATASGPADASWLHIEDAVAAVERALTFAPGEATRPTRWHVFHIVDGGANSRFPLDDAARPPFSFAPRHRLTDAATLPADEGSFPPRPAPIPSRPIRRVAIFGAGGPLAAVTAEALERDHILRLTDVRPLVEAAAAPPQSPGAPLPRPLPPPHEERLVDVTDPAQVLAAAEGMDALVNCTVVRPHPVNAFRVNLLGAYNVMRAAVTHGIRRVVHTGPIQTLIPHPAGFAPEFDISPDLPPRPGDDLYFMSKFLGQEVCRIFAEAYDLEVPTLLFCAFRNPDVPLLDEPLHPFTISWADAGEAMRQAVRAPGFPRPFEVLHINADLPHGKYPNDKAKRLLAWQPRDRFESHWRRGSE